MKLLCDEVDVRSWTAEGWPQPQYGASPVNLARDWLTMHAELVAARKVVEAVRRYSNFADDSWADDCELEVCMEAYDAVVAKGAL